MANSAHSAGVAEATQLAPAFRSSRQKLTRSQSLVMQCFARYKARHIVYRVDGPDGIYVGCTSLTLAKRWRQHLSAAKQGATTPFAGSIRRHGPAAFSLREIACCRTQYDGRFLESSFTHELIRLGERVINARPGNPHHLEYLCNERVRWPRRRRAQAQQQQRSA